MTTPSAYAKIRQDEKDRLVEATRQQERQRKEHEEQEIQMFNNIGRALAPYNNSNLDGHKVFVVSNSINRTYKVIVDKIDWLTFGIKWNSSNCSCEALCNCEIRYWLTMTVKQHKRHNDFTPYFPCSESSLHDEEKFAIAMIRMMDDFKYRDLR